MPYARCDLRDPDSIDELLETAGSGCDDLARMAGLPGTWPAVDVLNVNFLGMRHLIRGMLDRLIPGGSVVPTSSELSSMQRHT
jgi:hypothetical protein